MHGEQIACPLCGASEAWPWGAENGWKAGKCCNCGLVYLSPRPSRAEISAANELGQHRTSAGVLDVVHGREARKVEHYGKVFDRLFADRMASPAPVRWLDVGAGFGEVVEALQRRLPRGSVLEGIEPMHAKVAEARRRGLPITAKLLAELPHRYHVISLINVFSHLPDPRGFLRDLGQHLLPGGDLLIETGNGGDLPDARSFPGPLYLPDHLQFAGEVHLERFLNDSGFAVLAKHRQRTDTLRLALHWAAQKARGHPARIRLPYTSPFRTIFYRARTGRAA
jgi:SAM-dependent methyltransferase